MAYIDSAIRVYGSLVGHLPTLSELAATFSEALVRPISYADPTDDQWKKGVEPHINPYVLDHLAGILKFFRTADTKNEKSFRVSGTVANFIGASPQTLLQFVQANRVLFGDAA